jgi:hypothetical protein
MEVKLSLIDQDILYAIESSICMPAVPHKLEALTIPGVTGHYSQRKVGGSTAGVINRVGRTRLTTANADTTIKAVRDHFAARNQRFIWIVTEELSSPTDLTLRLEKAGFTKRFEMAGMYLAELTQPITLNPAVRVLRANTSDNYVVSKLYQKAFPLDQDVADLFVELINAMEAAHYLAYLTGVEEPVGVASMSYLHDLSVAVLVAAATLETYRGQGVYKCLLARRLADAHADAIQGATIQAIRTTSQPILSKLGFIERCNMFVYVWDPARTRAVKDILAEIEAEETIND